MFFVLLLCVFFLSSIAKCPYISSHYSTIVTMSQKPDISTVSVLKRERVRFTFQSCLFYKFISPTGQTGDCVHSLSSPTVALHTVLTVVQWIGITKSLKGTSYPLQFYKKRLPVRTQILSFLDVIITRLPEKLSGQQSSSHTKDSSQRKCKKTLYIYIFLMDLQACHEIKKIFTFQFQFLAKCSYQPELFFYFIFYFYVLLFFLLHSVISELREKVLIRTLLPRQTCPCLGPVSCAEHVFCFPPQVTCVCRR